MTPGLRRREHPSRGAAFCFVAPVPIRRIACQSHLSCSSDPSALLAWDPIHLYHPPHVHELPPDVLHLIDRAIGSLQALELLLLLRRSPETYWAASAVAGTLGGDVRVVRRELAALVNAGLVVSGSQTGAYRFAPRREADRDAVEQLAAAYGDERRLSIVDAIASRSVRALAGAFRF